MNELYAWQLARAKNLLELLESMDEDSVIATVNDCDSIMLSRLNEITLDWPTDNPVRKAIVSRIYDCWLREQDL